MKTRVSLLMVLALLAALFATPVTRADRPVTGGVTTIAARQLAAARSQAGQEPRPSAADRQPAPWKSAVLQGEGKTYHVEWNITASGSLENYPDGVLFTRRRIEISGEALVHKQAGGDTYTIPFDLMITDDQYQIIIQSCGHDHYWRSITDPGRYSGGPDRFWNHPGVCWAYQELDGTWSMENPFSDWAGFVVNGEWERTFTYRTDWKSIDVFCGGSNTSGNYTNAMMYYDVILPPLRNMPLRGDPTGTVFSLDTEYTVDTNDVPLTVNFRATVQEVQAGGCRDLAAPIDIDNPDLTALELNLQAEEDTTPDGEATIQARVTCEGVPVINAPVEVGLKVKDASGDHYHYDGKRPRGYIDGVEITTANMRVSRKTDEDGVVTFAINPGRDLTDKSRGIAGWYIADATARREGLSSPTKLAFINAHLDLPVLPENDELYAIDWYNEFKPHTLPLFGTPATVKHIQGMAKTWVGAQSVHNSYLVSKGKSEWPITQFTIWAISLPKGGLLDARFAWRPPFDRHRTGEEVLFHPFSWYEMSNEELLWYERVFRELSKEYGTWFTDYGQPLNLKITKPLPDSVESSMLPLSKSASTGPDVAVSAALVNPEGRFVAGAGQTVTYSVGVENVVSGTQASQVVLRAALPAGLNFMSANPTQSHMADPRTPVWDVGSLPDEGVPRTFEVVARIDPSTAVATLLTITATAMTSSQDTDPANNRFSDWGLTVQQPGPDLVIGSDLNGTALTVGEPVTFTIGLSNEGNASASNSWFDLTVPTGITITETSPTANVIPGGVRWDAGELIPGEELTATVNLQVDPGLLDLAALSPDLEPEYPLSFSMATGSNDLDIDPASNQVQVDKRVELPGPDLLVALQAQGTPVPGVFEVGQVVTYTLRYANFGNREADEVRAALLLWPGLSLMESQPAPTTNQLDTTTGVRTLTWDLGELSIGEEGAIELRLRVDDVPEVGSIIRADISSNNVDLNPADNVVMETRYEAISSHEGEYKIYLPVVVKQQ